MEFLVNRKSYRAGAGKVPGKMRCTRSKTIDWKESK